MFDEGFFLQWGKSLVMDTNYFFDPGGNIFNIEFEEMYLRMHYVLWRQLLSVKSV